MNTLFARSSILRNINSTKSPRVYGTAKEALAPLLSNSSLRDIYLHMGAATPNTLIQGVVDNADMITTENPVNFHHMLLFGNLPYLEDQYFGKFNTKAWFISEAFRKNLNQGGLENSGYIPMLFSNIPTCMREGLTNVDIALINVSPPDVNGWCSLGVSVDCSLAGYQSAKYVVAQINPQMPRTHGDSLVHISTFHSVIEADTPVHTTKPTVMSEADQAIAKYCASLIPDGATLQLGIGSIPAAVLGELTTHKDLGIHTELLTEAVIPLMKSGVVNNSKKKIYPHRSVTTFIMGTPEVMDFVNDNPEVTVLDVATTNSPVVIAKNELAHSVNSCIEIDLTGQIVSDSIGNGVKTREFSGIGGQLDFTVGSGLSRGGKPIFAFASQTNKGQSKIVPFLKEGGGVVTTRGHTQYVVTEYGVVNLFNKTLLERALLLTHIAHPDHRDRLFEEVKNRFNVKHVNMIPVSVRTEV